MAGEAAGEYSLPLTIGRVLDLYRCLVAVQSSRKEIDDSAWNATRRVLKEDWKILSSIAQALNTAVLLPADDED